MTCVQAQGPGGRFDPRPGWRSILEALPEVASRLRGVGPTEAPVASGPFDRPVRRAFAPGALLVGDAAGYYERLTGEGIYRGLRGAEIAEPYALEHLEAGSVSALAEYDRALRARLGGRGPAPHRRRPAGCRVRTYNAIVVQAPPDRCFHVAADVERWPGILPHYRRVRFLRKEGFGTGLVEMAAYRSFGPLRYPVWWVSEMRVEPERPAVLYRHVRGITTGMTVEWRFTPDDARGTRVEIVHEWADGPRWPLVGRLVAKWVIGPVFIHAVAGRTLRGVKRAAESRP